MISGRAPFSAGDETATLRRVIEDRPPPLLSEVPADLSGLIFHCLEKAADLRYQSMAEVKEELEKLAEVEQELEKLRRARQRAFGFLTGSVIALSLIVAYVIHLRQPPKFKFGVFTNVPEDQRGLASALGDGVSPTVTPYDGFEFKWVSVSSSDRGEIEEESAEQGIHAAIWSEINKTNGEDLATIRFRVWKESTALPLSKDLVFTVSLSDIQKAKQEIKDNIRQLALLTIGVEMEETQNHFGTVVACSDLLKVAQMTHLSLDLPAADICQFYRGLARQSMVDESGSHYDAAWAIATLDLAIKDFQAVLISRNRNHTDSFWNLGLAYQNEADILMEGGKLGEAVAAFKNADENIEQALVLRPIDTAFLKGQPNPADVRWNLAMTDDNLSMAVRNRGASVFDEADAMKYADKATENCRILIETSNYSKFVQDKAAEIYLVCGNAHLHRLLLGPMNRRNPHWIAAESLLRKALQSRPSAKQRAAAQKGLDEMYKIPLSDDGKSGPLGAIK